MPRTRGTTTERGLGRRHQQQRAALLRAALNTPCPGAHDLYGNHLRSRRCVGLMTDPRYMDLDHTTPRVLGGDGSDARICCSPCNRTAGTTLGNQLRAARERDTRRQW